MFVSTAPVAACDCVTCRQPAAGLMVLVLAFLCHRIVILTFDMMDTESKKSPSFSHNKFLHILNMLSCLLLAFAFARLNSVILSTLPSSTSVIIFCGFYLDFFQLSPSSDSPVGTAGHSNAVRAFPLLVGKNDYLIYLHYYEYLSDCIFLQLGVILIYNLHIDLCNSPAGPFCSTFCIYLSSFLSILLHFIYPSVVICRCLCGSNALISEHLFRLLLSW